MSIKAKFQSLLKKKKAAPTKTARIYAARAKVDGLFSEFIAMEGEIRASIAEIESVKTEALAEMAELNVIIASSNEEIAVQTAMADNLLQFINPVAGGMKATVSVDSTEMKLEDIKVMPADKDAVL